jgi:hypothetical protein
MHIRFDGYEIGCTDDSEVAIAESSLGETDIQVDDTGLLGRDGVMPGTDYLRDSQWTFNIAVDEQGSTKGVLEKIAPLERAWKAWANRTKGRVPLEYSTGHDGVWHRIYGRPRQYLPPRPDFLTEQGRGTAQISFQQQDPLHYAAPVSVPLLPSASAFEGGLIAPLVAPLVASGSSSPSAVAVSNGGELEAPLSITFYGPSTNPRAWAGPVEVVYRGSLAWDEHVVIDGMHHSVMLHGGGRSEPIPVPGRLSPHTLLTDLTVPPGETHWWYEAIDPSLQSKATFTWWDAYQSMQ